MNVVAVVAAKDRVDSVGPTVAALRRLAGVDRVVVVDDGSGDDTSGAARRAGAEVLRLPANRGKGGAVAAGVAVAPDADAYLLVDADVGDTASMVGALLAPVLAGEADMTIGVLPSAGAKGGFGAVKRLAGAGIRRACGFDAASPLSGQRVVRGPLLRELDLASRFGVETALTIDAVRAGGRVLEVPVSMDHRHTGRRVAGFRHRGAQGLDIARALWPRLTTARARTATVAIALLAFVGWALWSGARWQPGSRPLGARPDKVLLFGMPHLGFDDLGAGDTPNLDRLVARGAVGATTVKAVLTRPTSGEGYATLNAGARVRANETAGAAFAAGERVGNGTAAQAAEAVTGRAPRGRIVVTGYARQVRLIAKKHVGSEPGALGDALHVAGLRAAVVGNADAPGSDRTAVPEVYRPVAMALVDRSAAVPEGDVGADLLRADPLAPYQVRFDSARTLASATRALGSADVVAVDPGDLERANAFQALTLDRAGNTDRALALRRTDRLLGRLLAQLPPRTMVMVVSVSPAPGGPRLTPMVVAGPGVPHGYLNSPSVKRQAIVTITDVAPTVLRALGADVPTGMIGHAFRYQPGRVDLGSLRTVDRDASYRESLYSGTVSGFVAAQGLLYVLAIMVLSRHRSPGRLGRLLRAAVVASAAFPLATFLFRAAPDVAALGQAGVLVLVAIDVGIAALALRDRRHALSPLQWVAGLTVAVLLVDVCTGARLQLSSMLGYSLHTAARFFGVGNSAFAALSAAVILAGCTHVAYASRRREALVWVGAVFAAVVVVDAAPSLGNDLGGILTLVPVLGLTMVVLAGRRVTWRTVVLVAGAALLVVVAATAIDLLRPPDARTHLGRFASDILSGNQEGTQTVARKLATNLRVLTGSTWAWMVPIVVGYMVVLLVWQDRAAELLPAGSPLRVGLVAALAAGAVGLAVNDSGVIVTAIVVIYVGPFLTLLALGAEHAEPVLLPPLPAPAPELPAPVRSS